MRFTDASAYNRIAAAFVVVFTFCASAQAWPNRPNVVRAAEKLADEIERFDTALHEVRAPQPLLQRVHHFEQTVAEFVKDVRGGCSYQSAVSEMAHIRQDVGLVRDLIARYPGVTASAKVATEWRHVRSAYRHLDHEMFVHVAGRWSLAALEKLKGELERMDSEHR